MAKCEIIAIGSELLLGDIVNSNAAYISSRLANIGISVLYHTTVGDNMERIVTALDTASRRADIIITTGGLGPTDDDITHEAVAKFCQKELIFFPQAQLHLDNFFISVNRKPAKSNKRQTMLPASASIIPNPLGTALGVIIKHENSEIFTLPGVPQEAYAMLDSTVLPYLNKHYSEGVILSRTIKLFGLPEADIGEQVSDLMQGTNPTVGILASQGTIKLRITVKGSDPANCAELIMPIENEIHKRLEQYIWGFDEDTPESVIAELLVEGNKTLALAESCTGGMISARIVNISGSSRFYKGGVVSYSNDLKESIIGVKQKTLVSHGAVSEETAKEMAAGVLKECKSDFALAVTGIAGPTGGTKEKPVGTVCFGFAYRNVDKIESESFTRQIGKHLSREIIRERATSIGLLKLREFIIRKINSK